jgi:hypothetical protein
MFEIKGNGDMVIETGNTGAQSATQNLKLLKNGVYQAVVTADNTTLRAIEVMDFLPIPIGSERVGDVFILTDDGTGAWRKLSAITAVIATAKLTTEGANGSITITNGIVTAYTAAT